MISLLRTENDKALVGSAGGSVPSDPEAEHALNIVVFALLIGLELGLRGRAGQHLGFNSSKGTGQDRWFWRCLVI